LNPPPPPKRDIFIVVKVAVRTKSEGQPFLETLLKRGRYHDDAGRMMAVVPGDYVFSDPIAFRHLAQEEGTEIVAENVVIAGYQVYIVEQWACSRVHPVFVVTTFTGEESNKVCLLGLLRQLTVNVLRLLEKEKYADRLAWYFETLAEYHARPKDVPPSV
jgi:hypothetical protein